MTEYFQIATPEDDVDAYRSKQKEAEEQEEKALVEAMVSEIDQAVRTYLEGHSDKGDEVKEFIGRYVKKIFFDKEKFSSEKLKQYCQKIKNCTGFDFDIESLIPEDFTYDGMNYQRAWQLYTAITDDSMLGVRKKALAFRVLLEASLFLLVTKKQFDPNRIGSFYGKAIRGQKGIKLEHCRELKKMYDLSKKYHHGPDSEGSTLGLAALNPDEMSYFDKNIRMIHQWIVDHPEDCNPNDANYSSNSDITKTA